MQVAIKMWRGNKVPRSKALIADFSHKPGNVYCVSPAEVLPMRWTGGPRGVIESLFFQEVLDFKERFFPQFIRLLLYDAIAASEKITSVLRVKSQEQLVLQEHGQVSALLHVLQELRSGYVAKARAEKFSPGQENPLPGSISAPKPPAKTFKDATRPGENP